MQQQPMSAAATATADGTLPAGVWPVMLTPFADDGAIDWPALDALVDWYIDAGVAGLFAVCLSSEMYELSPEERTALAERVLARAAGRVPVAVGCGFGGDPETVAAEIRQRVDAGAAAAVLVANQLAPEDADEATWRAAAERILDRTGDAPLGLYESPQPYHRLLLPGTVGVLAGTGRFRFYKETSTDPEVLTAKVRAAAGTPLGLYNAHSPTVLAGLQAGGAGASNIAANVHPDLFAQLCRLAPADRETAAALQRFLAVVDPVVRLGYPLSAKIFLAGEGLPIRPVCRVTGAIRSATDLAALHAALRVEQAAWRERLANRS